jgi:putative phosphoribosyl transferase
MDYLSEKNERNISIKVDEGEISAILHSVPKARGIIIFAHGSGSSRFSPRNKLIARHLNENNFSTLLIDLLTPKEEIEDEITAELRFNIQLLSKRLSFATGWIINDESIKDLPIGYFGASTGAAAALISAADLKTKIKAIVSRGGRPDLAIKVLKEIVSPTLLIVGGNDSIVLKLNKEAYSALTCKKKLEIIPGASHLFEEPGKLEEVAKISAKWFLRHLKNP